MNRTIMIRAERPGDEPSIAAVVQSAYADMAYSDHREHLMVARLRQTGAFKAKPSLLAEVDGRIAGHILLTRAHIVSGETRLETLALAPLSVVPDRRYCSPCAVATASAPSPLSRVGKVSTPTMLIAGEDDARTPVGQAQQFYNALQLRHVPTALVSYPGASHASLGAPRSQLVSKTEYALAWFARYR